MPTNALPRVKLSTDDVEDFARHLCRLPEGCSIREIEDSLDEEYGLRIDQVEELLAVILPMTPTTMSGLTGNHYHALGIHSPGGLYSAVVKARAEE